MDQTNEQATHACHGCHQSQWGRRGVATLTLGLLSLFLLALSIKTFKEIGYVGGGVAETNAISVTGTGEAVVLPDTAEFTFTVTKEGTTAAGVRDDATKTVDAALAALKNMGVEGSRYVKNISYDLQPKYEWRQIECVRFPCDGTQVQTGFILNQSVQVKVQDLDRAGTAIEAVTTAGVESVSGLSFTTADEDKPMTDARKAAIDDARTKAERLAADLGVSIVRIVGFSEDGGFPAPYFAERVSGDMAATKAEAPVVPVGENTITSNVTITYEIR